MKDLISRQRVLKLLSTMPPEEAMTKTLLIQSVKQMDAPDNLVKDSQGLAKELVNDCISRKAALDALEKSKEIYFDRQVIIGAMKGIVRNLPSAQPEPLTDKEKRIFLAAMGREEKVCEEVDRNYIREPYEDSLMRVCKEIRRKVKGALWI